MKRISFLIVALFICTNLSSQTLQDAIRFSNLNVGGTARTVGVGGAFGALGADFAVLSINPAGLGMYRSSELVFTPSILFTNSNAELLGTDNVEKDSKSNFNFNNVGVVFQNDSKSASNKWVSSSFAIGYNRLANFNRTTYYEGSTPGSFLDRFVEQAFGLGPQDLSEFESYLAFQTGALYRTNPNDNTTWVNDYLFSDAGTLLYKKQSIQQTGAINEMVIAYGGNLSNKIMIGATVGVPFISYEETKIYEEEDLDEEIDFFNEYRYEELLETSGLGINLKLGLIYRINQMFRFGVSLHTPTAMSLNERYSATMRYDFTTDNSNGALEEASPQGVFDYKLRTPWKAVVSAAAIIGKSGFISADVEYLDYQNANFNLTENSTEPATRDLETTLNQAINDQLTSALNIRLGGEYAIQNFRIRGGYGISGSYRGGSDLEATNAISAGLGIRQENFYADLAYRLESRDEIYSPYLLIEPDQGQIVENEQNSSKIMLTFGFKF